MKINKNKIKLLFFINSLRAGGKERRFVELIKKLKNHPEIHCELVLTKKEIHYKEIFATGFKIHYIVRKCNKDPRLFYQFYKITKKYKPDIIHAWGNLPAIYAIPSKVLCQIRMINNQIVDSHNNKKNIILNHKLTFPFSDLIIANSKAGLKAYRAPNHKSFVIYNGFNFDRTRKLPDKDEIRKKYNIKTRFVIGMVASFSKLKDYWTYIHSAIIVLKKNEDVTFICIGSGNCSPYRNMVNNGFKDKIKFLGAQENVESIMNICDIGVLTTYGEGLSNALMEFMALGKPVIATEGGGTNELVENGKTGYLIPQEAPEILAKRIEYLLFNPNIRKKMGEAGISRIKNRFNIDEMCNSYLGIYKNLS